ncbi:HAD family hydrolase [Celeribacter sp.]|uniref:HAD family hydrolase n=1 Tax=Celeribacter sp. TaxID=1890673 RepID=UPI003A8DB3EB
MTDLICFDCDGVLIASERLAAETTAECLAEFGVELTTDEVLATLLGKTAKDSAAYIRATFGVELPATYQELYTREVYQRFREQLQPVAGIAQVLEALRLPSCVTSNSGHERLALTLGLTGLAAHFGPRVFSADDVAQGKPAPDLFYFAAQRMGVEAQNCLVIDDSPTGIAGAVAAGARAIGFTGGGHTTPDHADQLMAAGAFCTVATAQDLIPLLCADPIPAQ